MILVRLIGLIVAAGILLSDSAAQEPSQYFIPGAAGNFSCAKFVAVAESAPLNRAQSVDVQNLKYYTLKYATMEYAYGFITAANLKQPDYSKQVRLDNEAIEMALRKYCESHPTDHFFYALDQFVAQQLRQ